ncbi:MAG: hypothetical protein IKX00_00345 [Bacilli bacterium]|nr:hypothetical protein [Bacilli bacterium]
MNLNVIKDELEKKLNKNVIITEKGMRNRKSIFEGYIYKLYPNIFSIMTKSGEKTFAYSDIATKTIIIKYQ